MVALSPRFILLVTLCSLSGVLIGPPGARSAALQSAFQSILQENLVQSPFRLLPRSAATRHNKRHRHCPQRLIEILGIGVTLGWGHCAEHYTSRRSPYFSNFDTQGLLARDDQPILGTVRVDRVDKTSGETKAIGFLSAQPDDNFTLVPAQNDGTTMVLVNSADGTSSHKKLRIENRPNLCATYDEKNAASLTARPCTPASRPRESQDFDYDEETGDLRPFSDPEVSADKKSPSSNAPTPRMESVDLDDRDEAPHGLDHVTLVFVPNSHSVGFQQAAVESAEPTEVVTSTTTITTTVTLIGSSMTSAAGDSGIPSASSISTSSPSGISATGEATPTPSLNAEEVASRIIVAAQAMVTSALAAESNNPSLSATPTSTLAVSSTSSPVDMLAALAAVDSSGTPSPPTATSSLTIPNSPGAKGQPATSTPAAATTPLDVLIES